MTPAEAVALVVAFIRRRRGVRRNLWAREAAETDGLMARLCGLPDAMLPDLLGGLGLTRGYGGWLGPRVRLRRHVEQARRDYLAVRYGLTRPGRRSW